MNDNYLVNGKNFGMEYVHVLLIILAIHILKRICVMLYL